MLAALLIVTPPASHAAQNNTFPTKTIHITRRTASIHVDGRLDEPVWSQLEPVTGFVQTDPDEGAPVSERTEAFLFYDNDKLYFGFKCYDSDARHIIANLGAHDARTHSDSVDIFLDPFGDRRTGYWFSINSRGVQFDALLTEGSSFDSTWDGIWESAARVEDWGWTAEVAIPFKSIRFRPGAVWGINLSRDIVRKNERAFWQFVARYDGFFRPSKAALLEGISDIEPGRNMEFIPYGSTRFRRGALNPADDQNHYEGGADLRWGILPNATLNLTVNPDFADTEADEENISISRFELFFPEKRSFFNEGANFFATPLNLIFSRRIGARLPTGLPQRILFGAKLTGKIGPWSIGAAEARTQETRFADPDTGAPRVAPAANFFILRLKRDIWKNSTIGVFTANRDQSRNEIGSTQRVHAVDLNIVSGPYLKWSNQIAYNQNETTPWGGIHRVGAVSDFNYETDTWELRGGYKYLGRGFDISDIGFEPETDRHSADAAVQWKPFLNRYGIRQFFFELNQDISLDTSGLLQDAGSDADFSARFQNFWFARIRYSYNRVRFFDFTTAPNCPAPYDCSPAFGRNAPTRVYIEPRIRFTINSNDARRIYFSYEFTWQKFAQFRENFYGREQTHALGLNLLIRPQTRLIFNGTFIREFLLDGTPFQVRRLFISRVTHQFSRKLRTRFLGQISNDRLGQNFSVNSIVAYDFTARSAAIVGYNFQRRSPLTNRDLGHEFFIKLSYLFHF